MNTVLAPHTSRTVRLAVAVSYVANPLWLPAIAYGLIGYEAQAPVVEIVGTVGLALLGFLVVPVGYILYLIRKGEVVELDVPIRQHRIRPLLVSFVGITWTLVLIGYWSQTAGPAVWALSGTYLLNLLVLLGITLFWKISIHLLGLGTFLAVLVWLYPTGLPPGVWVGIAGVVALVMWARVRLKVHTPAQVVAGLAVGILVSACGLRLLG